MEPLYTFFIALQDVDDDMGHTVFLPKTHSPAAHALWNEGDLRQRQSFIRSSDAVQSALGKGDASIFDSRLLHCGRENTSLKQRVLFYFTISAQRHWPLPQGHHGSNSIRREDFETYTVRDLVE